MSEHPSFRRRGVTAVGDGEVRPRLVKADRGPLPRDIGSWQIIGDVAARCVERIRPRTN
jgi:hypothetical protein